MMRFIILLVLWLSSSIAFAEGNEFSMTTTAFLDQGALPVLYTCDGKDLSPQITWANPPDKTQSYAIVISDPDAPNGTWYHWVVYNIPNNVTSLDQGVKTLPAGAMIGKNSWNKNMYNGPCPPKGSVHTYIVTLYALDTKLDLTNADGKTLLDAIKDHILKQTQLSMVYSRWLT